MKKIIIVFVLLIVTSIAHSQYYSSINQTAVAISQRTSVNNNITNVTINDYNVGLSMIANEISAFRNSWENKKKREDALAKAQSQINLVKITYNNSEHYPDKIIDGWHSVIVTDTYNYCQPAKVFINNNQIKEFVIYNCFLYSQPFVVLSAIKKGKALLSVDMLGPTDTLEMYFTNDIEQPTIVDKPFYPAKISFWCDSKSINKLRLSLNNGKFFRMKDEDRPKDKPECDASDIITFKVKPGYYNFIGQCRGSINWEGNIEAKENMCFIQLLNKENRKK